VLADVDAEIVIWTNVTGKWKTPVTSNRMWGKVEEYEGSGEADKWVGAAMKSHFAQIRWT